MAQKITAGKTATIFAPSETCTKAQILTFLWRANGQPEPAAANPYSDVVPREYFYKAALRAAEQGLVSGSAFGASAHCTRALTVKYLWTLAGKPEVEKSTAFTDVPADEAYSRPWHGRWKRALPPEKPLIRLLPMLSALVGKSPHFCIGPWDSAQFF